MDLKNTVCVSDEYKLHTNGNVQSQKISIPLSQRVNGNSRWGGGVAKAKGFKEKHGATCKLEFLEGERGGGQTNNPSVGGV